MNQELKRKAWKVTKTHYIVLIFLCLIGALFGTEYKESVALFSVRTAGEVRQTQFVGAAENADIITDLIEGNLIQADETAQQKLDQLKDEDDTSDTILGHTQGVLADIVNQVSSGMFFVKLAQAIYSVVRSDSLASIIFIFLGLGGYALVWIFFTNVLQVVIHRFFLEARTYEKFQMRTAAYLIVTRKIGKAAKTMMMKAIFYLLWSLTVVGMFTKYFSYYLVTYIVAENPDLGWKRTLDLSRNMMNGHKMEAFRLELSMIGWHLLSIVTGGLSSLFWFNAYHTAVVGEFYARIRKEAQEKQLDDSIMLNDEYLYHPAEKEVMDVAYGDIVSEVEYVNSYHIDLTKVQRFFADWFGIWIGDTKHKLAYQDVHGREAQIEKDKEVMDLKCYPSRLSPLYIPEKKDFSYRMTWNRVYTFWSIVAMFFFFSFIGWIWEVLLTLINQGVLVNRGTMIGPWLPIYGCGGVMALTLLARVRFKPATTFVLAMIMSGFVEYFTSYFLEMKFGVRWWDYTGYFLTLGGRICAEGLLVFGVGCEVIVYFAAPMIDMYLSKYSQKILTPVLTVLIVLFVIDGVHSMTHPNMGHGITDNDAGKVTSSLTNFNEVLF